MKYEKLPENMQKQIDERTEELCSDDTIECIGCYKIREELGRVPVSS